MRRLLPWLLVSLALLLLLLLSWRLLHRPPALHALPQDTQLHWQDCWFEQPLLRPVHCAYLTIRAQPGNRPGALPDAIRLPVVYLPAPFWRRERPPIIYVAGGPGGASGLDEEGMPGWLDWLDQVDWPADVVLYDQRGVGLAEPRPDCHEVEATRRELIASELPIEAQYRRIKQASDACRDRLLGGGWDLTRFNSRHNADDVLALVSALGLPEWQLYGVSYGTRIALEVQRRRPPGLRALVLDSVYPPTVHGEVANPWLLNRSLGLLERTCELLEDCDAGPDRVAADLENALNRLQRRPLRLDMRDPDTGLPLSVMLDHEDLAWLVFESQYLWNNLHLLPGAVAALSKGHVSQELRRMLQESVDSLFDPGLNEAVASSVDCADNGPLSEAHFEAQRRQFPMVADMLALDWRYGVCRDWPSGDAGADFRQPVQGELPVLLLSGEFDPVTPPQWAQLAAQTQQQGLHLVFPGIGHGVLDSDACAVDMVRAFWRNPADPGVPACLHRY